MNTTKPEQKKAPATGTRKSKWTRPYYPKYPDSYVHARGIGSSWRSNERNA